LRNSEPEEGRGGARDTGTLPRNKGRVPKSSGKKRRAEKLAARTHNRKRPLPKKERNVKDRGRTFLRKKQGLGVQAAGLFEEGRGVSN